MGVSSDFCKRRMDWRSAAGDAGEIARNGDVGFFLDFFLQCFLGARVRRFSLEKHGLEVRCG